MSTTPRPERAFRRCTVNDLIRFKYDLFLDVDVVTATDANGRVAMQ